MFYVCVAGLDLAVGAPPSASEVAMNEVMPGQRWRARFDATLLTVIRRSVDNVQWLTQHQTNFEEAWYYTRHLLDDFVLVADDYYPTPNDR